MKLPESEHSLLLRTDFSDDTAWSALCEAVQVRSDEGFQAYVECVSDPAFDGLTVQELISGPQEDDGHTFVFIVDQVALTNPELPVLVVDLFDKPGRTFRVIPREMWAVENNLSIANMDFEDFADYVDPDGIFRGHPEG